jgi:hypothetical protein
MPVPAKPSQRMPLSGARSHGRTAYKRSKSLTAVLAIKPLTCYFLVRSSRLGLTWPNRS